MAKVALVLVHARSFVSLRGKPVRQHGGYAMLYMRTEDLIGTKISRSQMSRCGSKFHVRSIGEDGLPYRIYNAGKNSCRMLRNAEFGAPLI